MTHYSDLSPCGYFGSTEAEYLVAVGWLDPPHPIPEGNVDTAVVEKLRELLTSPTNARVPLFMGVHDCGYCPRTIRVEGDDRPIEHLDLSIHVFKVLKRCGIDQVSHIQEMLEHGEKTMLAIRGFGEQSLIELKQQLRAKRFPRFRSRTYILTPVGHGNLFVPGKGFLYAAPELILHYMVDHRYLPPAEFCQAVLDCPEIGSEKHISQFNQGAPPSWRLSNGDGFQAVDPS